ncbi:hypothetical protein BD779DRAFT_1472404 [Infundibulicybe gibba]|nr:hypothetical protein BD779DRAFT_1472404 [Infundibulicybe gibba]
MEAEEGDDGQELDIHEMLQHLELGDETHEYSDTESNPPEGIRGLAAVCGNDDDRDNLPTRTLRRFQTLLEVNGCPGDRFASVAWVAQTEYSPPVGTFGSEGKYRGKNGDQVLALARNRWIVLEVNGASSGFLSDGHIIDTGQQYFHQARRSQLSVNIRLDKKRAGVIAHDLVWGGQQDALGNTALSMADMWISWVTSICNDGGYIPDSDSRDLDQVFHALQSEELTKWHYGATQQIIQFQHVGRAPMTKANSTSCVECGIVHDTVGEVWTETGECYHPTDRLKVKKQADEPLDAPADENMWISTTPSISQHTYHTPSPWPETSQRQSGPRPME